ncbi:MAG TPA: hypothetical protein DD490_33020 [Acidobacteria bacterium]|nr:hypothetical protein [Acidobacteriota bacterium]
MRSSIRSFLAILGLAVLTLGSARSAGAAPGLATPDQILGYLVAHRDDVSLVSYTVTPAGTPDPADPVLRVNAWRPMPLASTIKIVLLAAYAREVAAGRLDPQEPIPLAQWDAFYLPTIDEGVHAASLAELGFASDELGFAVDPSATVPLDRILAMMIKHSDNAGADLLLARIGEAAVRATIAAAGLLRQDVPPPLTGLFLLAGNHEDGPLSPARLQELSRQTPEQRAARIQELEALYLDPAWKIDELTWALSRTPPSPRLVARAAHRLFPRGSAAEYARIMAGVATGTFLSPQISAIMRPHLEWPMASPQLAEIFSSYGTKGGSIAGVITEASWNVPRVGDFAGKTRVSVLFFREMPLWAFDSLEASHAQQIFQIFLSADRAFAERVDAAL